MEQPAKRKTDLTGGYSPDRFERLVVELQHVNKHLKYHICGCCGWPGAFDSKMLKSVRGMVDVNGRPIPVGTQVCIVCWQMVEAIAHSDYFIRLNLRDLLQQIDPIDPFGEESDASC